MGVNPILYEPRELLLLIIQKPVRKKFPLFLFILSYFTFILYFILAYSTYVLNIINLNMINKVGKKDNSIKNRNLNLTFPHQSEIENFILFFFHFMPIGVPKVPFRSPGEGDTSWVDI